MAARKPDPTDAGPDDTDAPEAPEALTGVTVPQPLNGLGLAERAAREMTGRDLADALNRLAHRARALNASDRPAVLREAAQRVARLARLERESL